MADALDLKITAFGRTGVGVTQRGGWSYTVRLVPTRQLVATNESWTPVNRWTIIVSANAICISSAYALHRLKLDTVKCNYCWKLHDFANTANRSDLVIPPRDKNIVKSGPSSKAANSASIPVVQKTGEICLPESTPSTVPQKHLLQMFWPSVSYLASIPLPLTSTFGGRFKRTTKQPLDCEKVSNLTRLSQNAPAAKLHLHPPNSISELWMIKTLLALWVVIRLLLPSNGGLLLSPYTFFLRPALPGWQREA